MIHHCKSTFHVHAYIHVYCIVVALCNQFHSGKREEDLQLDNTYDGMNYAHVITLWSREGVF